MAYEHGINFVDTAPVYGSGVSESLIGDVLQELDRNSIIVATKFWPDQSKPADLRRTLEQSLTRLKTDYIDIFQQHWPTDKIDFYETLNCLLELKREGRIRAIGVSNWQQPQWQRFAGEAERFKMLCESVDFNQLPYSLLWRNCEPDVVEFMQKHEIGLLAYSPLCQGLLAHVRLPSEVPDDYRAKNIFYKGEFKNTVEQVLKLLSLLAEKYAASPAQIALAWVLAQPAVSSVIVGITDESQLTENIAALSLKLEPQDLVDLGKTSAPIAERLTAQDTLWRWRPE